MKRSPKLVVYGAFAAFVFVLALALGRPELAALAAPFALILVLGLASPRPGMVRTALEVKKERVLEGDEVEAELVTRASSRTPALYLSFFLPHGVRLAEGEPAFLLGLDAEEERRVPLRLACDRWGAYKLGDAIWRVSDAAGLRFMDARVHGQTLLQVYPRTERLWSLVKPLETQPFAGNRLARARGEGIEFADIRPYVPGDRLRHVNWRASSLHQTLHVNEQHPERNSDVIIFVDSFAEARGQDEGTLDLAVRAAASLASHYLSVRDRVGFVSFGGLVRWLTPSSGSIQHYRIIEALLETEIAFSFAWKDIDALPSRSLTPQALVVAVTPLLDERGLHALLNLRRRGFDLVVIEISPLAYVGDNRDSLDILAARFWRLWRDAMRFRFEQSGVAVIEWDGRVPLAAMVEEVTAFHRFARYASA
jgi:uncharacterized protein (DUF58 family)